MSNLRNIKNQDARDVTATSCFSKPGLAAGTSAGTIKTTAAAEYSIGGITFSKAATDNVAVTAGVAQPASSTAIYVVAADAAGAITTVAGRAVTGANTPVSPLIANSLAAIGAFKIVTNASASFTPGTTAFNAAGVTATFFDLARVPPTL